MEKKVLSDREKLIISLEKRIKDKNKRLAYLIKNHREIEKELFQKIKLNHIQLNALKK